jgi:hypothetical protein
MFAMMQTSELSKEPNSRTAENHPHIMIHYKSGKKAVLAKQQHHRTQEEIAAS